MMGVDKKELEVPKKQARERLEQMLLPIEYTRPELVKPAFKKIPFLSRLIKSAAATNNAAKQLSALNNSTPSALASSMQFGGLSLAILDFFLVPIDYLSAYISGQKIPINLNNNARWAYAGVGFGLGLSALLVPGAAPIIGLVGAGLSLGVGSFLLGKTLYERYQLSRQIKAIKRDIIAADKEMEEIKTQAGNLLAQTPGLLEQSSQSIDLLENEYIEKKTSLISLKTKEYELEQAIKSLGTMHVLDRGLGAVFAGLAVVGTVVAIFFPPIGLGILAAVSAASITYLAGRLLTPLIVSAKNWFLNKLTPAVVTNNTQEKVLASKTENSESMTTAPTPVLQEERNSKPAFSTTRARSNSAPQKHDKPLLTLDEEVRPRSHSTPLNKEALKKIEQEKPSFNRSPESDSNRAHPQ